MSQHGHRHRDGAHHGHEAHHDAHHDPAHAHHHPAHVPFSDPQALTQVLDDPARDEWQRPDDVLRALALEPSMTVADVGAGTGYFAMRLARAVPRGEVLAVDASPELVRFLGERAEREKLTNVQARLATSHGPGLAPGSVDRILVVHVWHHLAHHEAYARELAAALRPGGRLLVVDFSPAGLRGPPAEMRLAPEVLVALLADVGLAATISEVAPPDQYLVEAIRTS